MPAPLDPLDILESMLFVIEATTVDIQQYRRVFWG